MSGLINAALERSRVVILALVFLLVAGVATYVGIPKEANPDINIPVIYVAMSLDGVSPEDAERLMVRPMEEELRSIEGIKEMTASAYEGGANVVLEFEAGFDADGAILDVREAVDRVRPDLPDSMDEPTVNEVNFSLFPVIVVILSGDVPERTLVDIARSLRDEIEGIGSVLQVNIGGDREEVVEIVIDPLLVESYGLNGNDVATIVQRSNRLVAAGTLDTGTGRFPVKVPGLIESLDDILDIPVSVEGDAVVRFADIATIRRTFEDPQGFARLDGRPAVALEIVKRSGENVIDTIEAVRAAVERERAFWPETLSQAIEVTYSQDQSRIIRTMLQDLQNNVISAVLLVMIVIVGALGLRSAGLVGVAIPGSFLTGILVLGIMGLTVNIVVLFSLILAVGMLVDGAIVVTEFADRKMAEGVGRREAYGQAARRMAWPITASTLTTLAAFMPLLFWPGVVGEFMRFMPITLSATLAASLLMALIFVPTLGSRLGRFGGGADTARLSALETGDTIDLKAIGGSVGLYLKTLSRALRHPGLVLTGAAVTLVAVWVLFGLFGRGVEFFPDVEPENAVVLVHARGNLSIYERDALVREVEAEVLRFRDEFASIYSRTGGGQGEAGFGQDVAEDVIGVINLEFKPWGERRPADAVLGDIRAATAGLPGIRVETREPEEGPPVGKPVQVELSARNPELLPEAVAAVRAYMESLDGLIDIEDDRPIPGIEWQITVDRAHAARFGIDVALVGDAVQLITNGLTIGTYRPNDSDDEIDLKVRYPAEWRSIEQLGTVRIVNDAGNAVPISNFVDQQPQPLVGTLNRTAGRRVMTVGAELAPGMLADDMVRQIDAWLADGPLPAGVDYRFRGEDEEQKAAADFLSKAFVVALFLMAIILVTQFNSFYSAFLILSAVVMSTVGVLIGLLITGQPFGIVMTGVGVIALAGIVVNNNIVLIDTFDRVKQSAADARTAILQTGAQRLRPVVLTTVTTVLGLMPMVLSANIDFVSREVAVGAPSTQWWVGLATAIVFGLTFATVLTLVVTPCALMLRARVAAAAARRRARRGRAEAQPTLPDGVLSD
ncbi:MAG: AcrB/AcrD/AcrF family protein [Alphaproteobacteria bacterium]|jgi:multidrug efflux pump|nr:AcrB/AcrD/AcrF family protein [Alphaproteobacteria bacterium]